MHTISSHQQIGSPIPQDYLHDDYAYSIYASNLLHLCIQFDEKNAE